MSVIGLKRALDELSKDERLEISAYMDKLMRDNDPEWPGELERRIDSCIAGKGYSYEDLQKIHQKLCDELR